MSSETLLVVDDSPVIVRLLSLALTQNGYQVVTAADGEEGLARVRELSPPLVFLDAMMPKLNGYEVCEAVRADESLARRPYVIMLTAAGQETDRERAEAVGVDEFMTKPFSPSALIERVREVLETGS